MSKNVRIITAALPFVNNIPHLGNVIGSHLPADIFARYCRLAGYETYFVGGTDEHGTATEFTAQKQGITPKKLCDTLYKEHKKIYDWFKISYDNFSRTSRPLHHKLVQEFFLGLHKNGYITEKEIKIPFCLSCDKGLADRYIKGTCPHCGYEKADGDQCEKCASVLNPIELVEPFCAVCESHEIEFRDVKHLFLDLEKAVPKISKWLDENKELRSQVRNLAKGWIKRGIEPRCITRDLKWGVPVPLKGFEDKVFYVWFDNVLGYVTSTVELLPKKGQKLWQDPKTQTYYFVGKDNIPFHTIFWPGQILGEGSYVLPHNVVGLQYLNFEGKKFSKSKKVGVFADQVQASGIPLDYWRFYLLNILPETKDTDFSVADFQERVNKELIGNFGNFVNRTLNFIWNKCDGKVEKIVKKDVAFEKKVRGHVENILNSYEHCKLRDALLELLKLSDLGNQYFNEKEPWKTNDAQALAYCYELCRILGILFSPVLVDSTEVLKKYLNTKNEKWEFDYSSKKIKKPAILYQKLEDLSAFEKESFPLDLRLGKVVAVEEHPKSDRLFVFTVDFGNEIGKKQCVTSLREHLGKEAFLGKKIVFCMNLKPAKFRGELSEVMILAAEEGKKIILLEVEGKIGSAVVPEGLTSGEKQISFDEYSKVEMKVKKGNVVVDGKKLLCGKTAVSVKAKDGSKVC